MLNAGTAFCHSAAGRQFLVDALKHMPDEWKTKTERAFSHTNTGANQDIHVHGSTSTRRRITSDEWLSEVFGDDLSQVATPPVVNAGRVLAALMGLYNQKLQFLRKLIRKKSKL
eukprot:6453275-Amphidinium_carterae.1